jgi:hypothetical protein
MGSPDAHVDNRIRYVAGTPETQAAAVERQVVPIKRLTPHPLQETASELLPPMVDELFQW